LKESIHIPLWGAPNAPATRFAAGPVLDENFPVGILLVEAARSLCTLSCIPLVREIASLLSVD
jgi:hypothetical protein